MHPDCKPKTRTVRPTLLVKIARRKMGVNRHFQASWASQPMGSLLPCSDCPCLIFRQPVDLLLVTNCHLHNMYDVYSNLAHFRFCTVFQYRRFSGFCSSNVHCVFLTSCFALVLANIPFDDVTSQRINLLLLLRNISAAIKSVT